MNKNIFKVAASALTALSFSAVALAANPLILDVQISPTDFYNNVPGQTNMILINYNFNTGGYETAPVLEQIKDKDNNVVYEFGAVGTDDLSTGPRNLSWEGKYNVGENSGNFVPNGEYKLYIYSETASPPPATYLSPAFEVKQAVAPKLSFLAVPEAKFNPETSSNYKVKYAFETGNGTEQSVKLTISGDGKTETKTATPNANGDYEITWDGRFNGQLAKAGNYSLKLESTSKANTHTLKSNELTANFEVISTPEPTPTPDPTPKNCAGFTDIPSDSSKCAAFTYVKSIGAITGNPDGTFDPKGLLQRDQVAKIALETFGLFDKQQNYCKSQNPFPDVTELSWSFQYICRAKDLLVVTGYKAGADAGFYRPARSVNRAEFLAIMLRNLPENMPAATNLYSDVNASDWFAVYAQFAKNNNLYSGNLLNPQNFATREEVAEVIYKLHQAGKIK